MKIWSDKLVKSPRPAPQATDAFPPKPALAALGHLPVVVDVRALLGDQREITLALDEERYRLRITAQGKLILTK